MNKKVQHRQIVHYSGCYRILKHLLMAVRLVKVGKDQNAVSMRIAEKYGPMSIITGYHPLILLRTSSLLPHPPCSLCPLSNTCKVVAFPRPPRHRQGGPSAELPLTRKTLHRQRGKRKARGNNNDITNRLKSNPNDEHAPLSTLATVWFGRTLN